MQPVVDIQLYEIQEKYRVIMKSFNERLQELENISMNLTTNSDEEMQENYVQLIKNIKDNVDEIINIQNFLEEQNQTIKGQLLVTQQNIKQLLEQNDMLLKDVDQQREDLDKTQNVLETLEQELEFNRLKEMKLIEELNYYQHLKQVFQDKEQKFQELQQECDSVTQQNNEMERQLKIVKGENEKIEIDCEQLEEQIIRQTQYLDALKDQHKITEQALEKLATYQESIQNKLQQQQTKKKESLIQNQSEIFDPIEYLKTLSLKQQDLEREILKQNQGSEQRFKLYLQELISSSSSSFSSTNSYLNIQDREEIINENIPSEMGSSKLTGNDDSGSPKPAWGIIVGGVCFIAAIVILRKPLIRLFFG